MVKSSPLLFPLLHDDEEQDAPPGSKFSGIGIAPRILRKVHYPKHSIPHSPSIDATLTADPLPSVPHHVKIDPALNRLINTNPHLFKISTPINVDFFATFVRHHPRPLYVKSVIDGLRSGFWPCHSGIFQNVDSSKEVYPQEEEDWEVIRAQVEKDWKAGYLSEPFKIPALEMLISPMFGTKPAVGRRRGVVDQTGSGINAGIDSKEISTVLDSLVDLGRILRQNTQANIDPKKLFGFKSDVSSAFRNLPVSKFWQVRQVVKIKYLDELGVEYFLYFVDQRLVLGNSASPYIWGSFMGLVMWGIQFHFKILSLTYVDDVFGEDSSGIRLSITNPTTGTTNSHPRSQAIILYCWNLLGLPWADEKQEDSNILLVILGFDVSIEERSFTLSNSRKIALAEAITTFLSKRRPNLREWQVIAGWCNWALPAIPYAKPALLCLYAKMAGKSQRLGQIYLSKEVLDNLTWFRDYLLSSPPLSLLNPCLEEWTPIDADIVVYSDACCVSDTGLPGLGFWAVVNGQTIGHFYRFDYANSNIYFLEALAAHSAIDWALKQRKSQKQHSRILLYSDSTLTIFAYDSGKGDAIIMNLVWDSYRSLAASRADLRVRHIAGIDNIKADELSRKSFAQLQQGGKFSSLINFSPSTSTTLRAAVW